MSKTDREGCHLARVISRAAVDTTEGGETAGAGLGVDPHHGYNEQSQPGERISVVTEISWTVGSRHRIMTH